MVGPRCAPFLVLVLLVFGPGASEGRPKRDKPSDDQEHQEALSGLLSRLSSSHNASDSGLVFMPPTFSVDIVSLLRWAVERDTQHPSAYPNIARYGAKTVQSAPSYYNWQNINTVTLGGKQYFFSRNQKATWFDALSFCRSFGMDLVSIESLEENNLLVNHLDSIGLTGEYVLTSGHKIGRSTYVWLNGEQLVYEDWNAGEPAQFTTENCLIFWKKHWFDLPCDYATYFVCEG